MERTIAILIEVIKGLTAIIDEQSLLIQRMMDYIRREASNES